MPIVYTKIYDNSLIDLNEDIMYVYVESYNKFGGGRDVIYLRQHERGIPLTMKETHLEDGILFSSTETRDLEIIKNEFSELSRRLERGNTICVPIYPILEGLISLEKHSPKLEKYVKNKMENIFIKFPMTPSGRMH